MFAFILILHSFQLIFMDSAVYRESFFYICILHIFLHSFLAFVYHFCISLSAFLFLHFSFCISASVLFLCIQLL